MIPTPLVRRARSIARHGAPVLAAVWLAGCASGYRVPGARADLRALGITDQEAAALTDGQVSSKLRRRPTAAFPASIAAVRVQGPGYCSETASSFGSGRFSVVTVRDVETDEQFRKLAGMPMVQSIQSVNRLVLPDRIDTDTDLRAAAAAVQADVVLVYTFDTQFGSESKVAPLGVITLGLFPEVEARVTSTASAAFLDTRTGFVYGLCEATAKTDQLANAWTTKSAIDDARRRAETEAFGTLVDRVRSTWGEIVAQYAAPAAPRQAAGLR